MPTRCTGAALGAIVEEAFGPLSHELIDDDPSGFTRALGNWYRLNYLLATDHGSAQLEPRMSVWHKTAFRLLYEWWTASYQEPSSSLAASLEFARSCNDLESIPPEDGGLEREQWQLVLRRLQVTRWPEGDITEPSEAAMDGGSERHYHERMTQLFLSEFVYASSYVLTERAGHLQALREARQDGAQFAFRQKLGWGLLHNSCHSDKIPSTAAEDGTGTPRDGDQSSVPEDPVDLDTLSPGPIIEPCSWLEEDGDWDRNLPYYLWDVQQRRTVESSRIRSRPEYTAISHTWGRWTKLSPIQIEGVPWRVPQNTRFEVQQLADLLTEVPGKPQYIWFDLLCIPQDGSIIGAREISRQAAIFKGARHVIAWMNDVDSFLGLQHLARWQLLQLLRFRAEEDNTRCDAMVLDGWGGFAWERTGLLVPCESQPAENWRLNPWFTSLWTLQEVSLRPDVWLCTRDWKFLSCDGAAPLSLGGFVSILEEFTNTGRRDRHAAIRHNWERGSHLALIELHQWRARSGLSKLASLSRVDVITLASLRECKERRAEAIMSALGVKDWYNEELDKIEAGREDEFRAKLERDLVLGSYPVKFVHELCRKIPGDFFGAFVKRLDPALHEMLAYTSPAGIAGSMLPFTEPLSHPVTHSSIRAMTTRRIPAYTHTSVLAWSVLATGQVRMPHACLASLKSLLEGPDQATVATGGVIPNKTTPEQDGVLPADFLDKFGDPDCDIDNPAWLYLNRWMFDRTRQLHAVVVEYAFVWRDPSASQAMLWVSGVILERLPQGSLVRRTNFTGFDRHAAVDLEKVDSVDWIVD